MGVADAACAGPAEGRANAGPENARRWLAAVRRSEVAGSSSSEEAHDLRRENAVRRRMMDDDECRRLVAYLLTMQRRAFTAATTTTPVTVPLPGGYDQTSGCHLICTPSTTTNS